MKPTKAQTRAAFNASRNDGPRQADLKLVLGEALADPSLKEFHHWFRAIQKGPQREGLKWADNLVAQLTHALEGEGAKRDDRTFQKTYRLASHQTRQSLLSHANAVASCLPGFQQRAERLLQLPAAAELSKTTHASQHFDQLFQALSPPLRAHLEAWQSHPSEAGLAWVSVDQRKYGTLETAKNQWNERPQLGQFHDVSIELGGVMKKTTRLVRTHLPPEQACQACVRIPVASLAAAKAALESEGSTANVSVQTLQQSASAVVELSLKQGVLREQLSQTVVELADCASQVFRTLQRTRALAKPGEVSSFERGS